MAFKMSASEARCQVLKYANLINEVEEQAEKNFNDMDFENSNRREEMESLIKKIRNDCTNTIDKMEMLYFEP